MALKIQERTRRSSSTVHETRISTPDAYLWSSARARNVAVFQRGDGRTAVAYREEIPRAVQHEMGQNTARNVAQISLFEP